MVVGNTVKEIPSSFLIRLWLFLRKFRRLQYAVPLAIFVVLQILLQILRGIIEEIVFSTIASYIPISRGTVVIALGLLLGIGILAILIWMYVDARRDFTSQHLQNTLKEMHKRMLRLKDVRLSQNYTTREELEAMVPVLMHKLGIVDIGDWENFIKSTTRQAKRPVTQRTIRNGTWHYKVASVLSRMQADLCNAKASTVDNRDLDTFVEWFDGQSWSLAALRSNDKQWTNLYGSIEPFMRDNKLRQLIDYHIDTSYVSCNSLLVERYTREWANSLPIRMLRQILLTGALSPRKVDSKLSALLGDIDKRMHILKRKGRRVNASA